MTDDMHGHRREHDTDDSRARRLEAAAESSVAKFGARIVTPVLLMITLALVGFIGQSLMRGQTDGAERDREQGRDIEQIKSDIRNVNTRLDEGVIRQVDTNTEDIKTLKSDVETIKRVVRTP